MKNSLKKALIMLLMICLTLFFAACSGNDAKDKEESNDTETTEETDISEQAEKDMAEKLDDKLSGEDDIENPLYDNEIEGAEVKEKTADESEFYGKWEATSKRAAYLYGSLSFNIKKNGKWDGIVSDEKFSGEWEYNGTGITLSSELVNCDMFIADNDVMMLRDHDIPDDLIVLTPAE